MSDTQTWTQEAIQRFILQEQHGYQKIALPFGLSTPGRDRQATCDRILGPDLTGLSVLDVGCAQGYFCFEALKRGARRAVGWEIDANRLRQARTLAEILDAKAEFVGRNIEAETPTDSFDVVLCLNVLHHFKHPLATLDKLLAMTRQTLILEVASLGRHDRRRLGMSALRAWCCARAPVVMVGSGPQTYYFTPRAMRQILRQRPLVADVSCFPSEFKNRFFVQVRRQALRHAVVVAAPYGAGHSAVIQSLQKANAAPWGASLNLPDLASWPLVNARHLRRSNPELPARAVIQYDFIRPDKKAVRSYATEPILQLLKGVERLTVLTLWVDPSHLPAEFEARKIRPLEARLGTPSGNRRLASGVPWRRGHTRETQQRLQGYRHILNTYRRPQAVIEAYRQWLAFLDVSLAPSGTHHLVAMDGGPRLVTPGEWEAQVRVFARQSDSASGRNGCEPVL